MDKIVEYKDLKVSFFEDEKEIKAVNKVSFSIKKGEIIGIVGESGSGKSVTAMSLMNLILAENKKVEGEILFKGKDILTLKDREIESLRGSEIGAIYQDPLSALNPVYKVGAQIVEGIVKHNHISKKEGEKIVLDIFKKIGISEEKKVFDAYPNELSGGMRQRVLIAMAIVLKPDILIADEPTTALDVTIEAQILELLKEINRDLKTTIIVITHDFGVVAELCDYVVVMYGGKVVEEGDVFSIFDNPKHPYTKALLKSRPSIDLDFEGVRKLEVIKGNVELMGDKESCIFYNRCEEKRDICSRAEFPKIKSFEGGHKVACYLYDGEEKWTKE